MRICMFVTNEVTRDPRVSRHAETLGAMGHEVMVVCPMSQTTASQEQRELYAIRRYRAFVSLRDVFSHPMRRYGQSPEPRKDKSSKSLRYHPSHILRVLSTMKAILVRLVAYPTYLTWTLWKVGREFNAHIYFTNDFDTLLAGVLCAMTSRPLVHDAHELWPDQFVGMAVYPVPAIAWLRILEGILLRRANVVVTVNEFIAEELQTRYRIDKPRVILNVPAINDRDTPQRRHRHEASKKIALYQGLHTFHRGLENLVSSCEYLEDDITLVLRGYGPNENRLREIGEKFTNVRFDEPVPMRDLVSAAASTADIGIVPYLPVNINNYFASPNKLFEYIQAGLPVVGSDLPFLRKIIIGNGIGYVFDPHDPRSIAEAINAATRDGVLPTLRNNVLKIRRRYSWSEEQKELIKIVHELAKS